jgi:riboflavin transporter FmnP
MFMGGVIRWLVDRRLSPEERDSADADSGPGVLFSSGLIAGGAIMGVVLAGLAARQLDAAFNLGKALGAIATSNVMSLIAYVLLLALPLYLVARRVQRTDE